MELIDTWNINRYICKVLHKERIITQLYCRNYLPLNQVKVLFSDNNSDVFAWNWLILGTVLDIYVRCCTKQELQLWLAYCQIHVLLDIKIHQSITLLLFVIILNMYSYVLYYNIKISGYNAVSAFLLLLVQSIDKEWYIGSHIHFKRFFQGNYPNINLESRQFA